MVELPRWRPVREAPFASLNLATNPGGGERAFFGVACGVALVLLGIAVNFAVERITTGETPQTLLARERILQAEQAKLAETVAAANAKVRDPGTIAILERTEFLNELLVRKGVSWTRTFLDLEEVLPPSVRILALQPEVAYGDTVLLDMTVSAKEPADFIEFLRTLEGSAQFGSPALRGSAPPDDGDPTFRYQLAMEYVQRP